MSRKLFRASVLTVLMVALVSPGAKATVKEYPGFVKRELYLNIGGGAVADLTNNSKYADTNGADQVIFDASFASPINLFENFGTRMSGLFIAPSSGNFIFYMASDDNGALFLSTDESPANKVQIASEPVWNGDRDWVGTARRNATTPENKSAPIALVGGKRYYIEALAKEGGGGDNLAVAVIKEGDPEPANVADEIPGTSMIALADDAITITQQPAGRTTEVGTRAVFTVQSSGSTPSNTLAWQWRKNGTAIPGATTQTYITDAVTLADNAAKISVAISNGANNAVSADAILTVIAEVPKVFIPCFLTFEAYSDVAGNAVQTLLDDPKYPDLPDLVAYITSANSRVIYPDDTHEAYGARMSGFFVPIEDGDFDFFIRSDDASQLFINRTADSTDPNSLVMEAEETGCCNAFQEPGDPKTTAAPIPMLKGKRYMISMLYKEGTGGDFGQIAVRRVGDATAAGSLPYIPGAYLGTMIKPGGNISITQDPANAAAEENQTATFTVAVTADPAPVCIQWLKNGTPVPGANSASYTTPLLKKTDDQAKFSAQVSVPGKVATSKEATVTVTADTKKPVIISVVGSGTLTDATVVFDAPVNQTAENKDNYKSDGGLTITSATRVGTAGDTIKLVTSKQTSGTKYTLTVNNVADTAAPTPNVIVADTKAAFTAWILSRGGILHKFFDGLTSNSIQGLKDYQPFIDDAPTWTSIEPRFEWPRDAGPEGGSNYGNQILGLLYPPVSGKYIFYVAADDPMELYLSTDENPANKALIAAEPSWNPVRSWRAVTRRNVDALENVSVEIDLVADKAYYIEAIHTEGGGGDNMAAAWQLPGAPEVQTGDSPIDGRFLASFANPDGVVLEITEQPKSQNKLAGQKATLTVTANATSPQNNPVSYQWQRAAKGSATFADIPGANGSSYVTPKLTVAADDGSQFRVSLVMFGAAEKVSDIATLTVTPDTVGPTEITLGSLKKGANHEVSVLFDEEVDPVTGGAIANYSITAGKIESLLFVPNDSAAVLVVSGLTAGTTYSVTAKDVKDLIGNTMPAPVTKAFKAADKLSWTAVGGNELSLLQQAVAVGENGFDLVSGGVAFWATYDETTFVYEEITGDFDKKVRVEGQDFSSQWARTGLMAREELDSGKTRDSATDPLVDGFSRYQHVHVNPTRKYDDTIANNSHETNRRLSKGGATDAAGSGGVPPYPNAWVRLQRVGSTFNMFRSNDAQNWVSLGSSTWPPNVDDPDQRPMPAKLFVGPDFGPENGNIPEDPPGLRLAWLARFRDYGDAGGVIPPRPTIGIAAGAVGKVVITFTGTLQSADKVNGPYTDAAGTPSPRTVDATAAEKYYQAK